MKIDVNQGDTSVPFRITDIEGDMGEGITMFLIQQEDGAAISLLTKLPEKSLTLPAKYGGAIEVSNRRLVLGCLVDIVLIVLAIGGLFLLAKALIRMHSA